MTRKITYKLAAIIITALFPMRYTTAQDIMTLHDCMVYAVENSVKIKLSEMDVDDARIERRDAILNVFTPEVAAGTYAYSNFGRSVDPETNTYVSTTSFNNGYSISGSITLFNGFSAVNNMKISRTALKMGIQKEKIAKDEICLAVMEAYYNAVYLNRLSEIIENQVETSRKSLALARKQEELGQKGYADVIEMEAELATREYDLISSRNKLSDALSVLKDLMFWPTDKELTIDISMTENAAVTTLHPENETENVIETALETLPSIAVARGAMQNAELDLRSARWRFSPQISVNAGWSTNYYTYPGRNDHVSLPFHTQFSNNGGEYIQLSLTFPIFSRLSAFSNLRKKRNESRRAALLYEQKTREIEAEVTRAVRDRDGAAAAFLQADKRAELHEETYHLNLKKFNQGLISPIEFQKASDNWLDAKAARLDALLKYYIRKSVVNYYNGISYIDQR